MTQRNKPCAHRGKVPDRDGRKCRSPESVQYFWEIGAGMELVKEGVSGGPWYLNSIKGQGHTRLC